MALPIKTTAEDVRAIVRYFRTMPTGATVGQAKAAIPPKLLDRRKMAAYGTWGFIVRDGERIKLTERGWALARVPDAEAEVFRAVIDGLGAYRAILEWTYHQQMDSPSAVDVAVYLHEHHSDAVGEKPKDDTLRDNAIAFFSVAEAAGFGRMVIGRAGHPTRLETNREAVRAHVEGGPETPSWTAPGDDEPDAAATSADGRPQAQDSEPTPELARAAAAVGGNGAPEAAVSPEQVRVFISHSKNTDIVEQIETMLGLADIESEIAVKEETTAIPVPDKVFDAMRRCHAGIIAVTADEGSKDDEGGYVVNANVLIEIGAAFVLYDRRVVLLWDKRITVPSNLQGLYRCEFEGSELSWSAGMKLMKAIQNFKRK